MNNKSFLAQCICAIVFLSIFSSCDSSSNQVKEMEEIIVLTHTEAGKLVEDAFFNDSNIHDIFTSEAIFNKVHHRMRCGARLDSITYIGCNWFKVSYDVTNWREYGYYEEDDYVGLLYWKINEEDNKFKLGNFAYAYSQCSSHIKDFPNADRIKFWFNSIKYDDVQPYFQGKLCKVKKNNKYGFINIEGIEIIPCKYDDIAFIWGDLFKIQIKECDDVDDSILRVELDNKYGLINIEGIEIIPCKYDVLAPFGGVIKVKSNNKYGLIDFYGKEIFPCKYDDLTFPENSSFFIKTKLNNKYGLITHEGKEIIPCRYDELTDIHHGIKVKSDDKYGFIDYGGKEIVACLFDNIKIEPWPMLKVQSENLWSYYTKEGTQATEFYEDIKYYYDMDNPMFAAKSNGKWGYLNKAGDILIPFVLDYAGEPNNNGTSFVEYNGQRGELDLNTRRFSRTYYNNNSYNSGNSSYAKRKCKTCNGNGSTSVTVGGVYRGQTRCTDCGGLGYFIQ